MALSFHEISSEQWRQRGPSGIPVGTYSTRYENGIREIYILKPYAGWWQKWPEDKPIEAFFEPQK